jgi:hypothetical protein
MIHIISCASGDFGPVFRDLHPMVVKDPATAMLELKDSSGRSNVDYLKLNAADTVMLHLPLGNEHLRQPDGSLVRQPDGRYIGFQSLAGRLECQKYGYDAVSQPYWLSGVFSELRRRVPTIRRIGIYLPTLDSLYMALSDDDRHQAVQPYVYAQPDFAYVDSGAYFGAADPRFAGLQQLDGWLGIKVGIEGRPNAGNDNLADRPSITQGELMYNIGRYDDPVWIPRADLTGPMAIWDQSSTTPQQRGARARMDHAAGFEPCVPSWDTAGTAAVRAALAGVTP